MLIKELLEKTQFPDSLKKTKGQIIPCPDLPTAQDRLKHTPTVIAKCTDSGAIFIMTKEDFLLVKKDGFVEC